MQQKVRKKRVSVSFMITIFCLLGFVAYGSFRLYTESTKEKSAEAIQRTIILSPDQYDSLCKKEINFGKDSVRTIYEDSLKKSRDSSLKLKNENQIFRDSLKKSMDSIIRLQFKLSTAREKIANLRSRPIN